MYLVDTNIWLERLLDQERSAEVGLFLAGTPAESLFMTDFAFHSIGVVLSKLKQSSALLQFVRDAFLDGAVSLVHLEAKDMESLVDIMQRFNLDFDDAYQYAAAVRHDLIIVSLDSDFDRTERGRKTPADIL